MSDAKTGQSVPRLEDQRFLTGSAVYADDLNVEGQLYGVVVRSTHAHAEINGIDVSAALEMPGVVAVYMETDLAADGVGHLPCGAELPPEAGLYVPPRPQATGARSVCRRPGCVRRRGQSGECGRGGRTSDDRI